ncbi:MAG TPA: metallophosphoesterase [Lentisphaeria bacterium]|nr:metallophosphoesterase [Lentisphaeria bacterium]
MGKRILRRQDFGWKFQLLRIASPFLFAAGFCTYWLESSKITLRRWPLDGQELPVPMTGPLRILHLTDPHLSGNAAVRRLENAISLGLAQQPDLALFTGDFEFDDREDLSAAVHAALLRLGTAVPTYACLGNHDYASGEHGKAVRKPQSRLADIRACLAKCQIQLLQNQRQEIVIRGQRLAIVGLGDWWWGDMKGKKCLKMAGSEDLPVLLMSHNPDTHVFLQPFAWNVMFSGHAHAGQFRLPFTQRYPFAPLRDRSLARPGLHALKGGRVLCESAGVGAYLGVRLNSPADVTVLDIGEGVSANAPEGPAPAAPPQ